MRKGEVREQDLLTYIKSYYGEHGYAPSYAEIADGVGLYSSSSINYYMKKLFRKGLLASEHEGLPRAFRIVESEDYGRE